MVVSIVCATVPTSCDEMGNPRKKRLVGGVTGRKGKGRERGVSRGLRGKRSRLRLARRAFALELASELAPSNRNG